MKNTNTFLSYHQLLFPIILTEFLRRASLLPLEHTIEIGQIVEAAVIAHLCNGTRGIYQHTRGKAQTDINNVVVEMYFCTFCTRRLSEKVSILANEELDNTRALS